MIYILPSGYIFAVTSQVVRPMLICRDARLTGCMQVSINIIVEILPGTILPGQPIPNMVSLYLSARIGSRMM